MSTNTSDRKPTASEEIQQRLLEAEYMMLDDCPDSFIKQYLAEKYEIARGTAQHYLSEVRKRWKAQAKARLSLVHEDRYNEHRRRLQLVFREAILAGDRKAACRAAQLLAQLDGYLMPSVKIQPTGRGSVGPETDRVVDDLLRELFQAGTPVN